MRNPLKKDTFTSLKFNNLSFWTTFKVAIQPTNQPKSFLARLGKFRYGWAYLATPN